MNFRTPLAKARGLGSAKDGSRHWWMQRVTAVALIPLTLWFGVAIALLPSAAYVDIVDWIRAPWNSILLISFIISVLYHSVLGLQVVIEDYVHAKWVKITGILAMKLVFLLVVLICLYATLRIVLVAS